MALYRTDKQYLIYITDCSVLKLKVIGGTRREWQLCAVCVSQIWYHESQDAWGLGYVCLLFMLFTHQLRRNILWSKGSHSQLPELCDLLLLLTHLAC